MVAVIRFGGQLDTLSNCEGSMVRRVSRSGSGAAIGFVFFDPSFLARALSRSCTRTHSGFGYTLSPFSLFPLFPLYAVWSDSLSRIPLFTAPLASRR